MASSLNGAAAQMTHVQNSSCREGDGHGTWTRRRETADWAGDRRAKPCHRR